MELSGISLDKLKAGQKAKILYLLSKNNPEIHRLLSLGLSPGCEIELIQRYPSFVVQVNETQLAFDEFIAEAVMVDPI